MGLVLSALGRPECDTDTAELLREAAPGRSFAESKLLALRSPSELAPTLEGALPSPRNIFGLRRSLRKPSISGSLFKLLFLLADGRTALLLATLSWLLDRP